MWGGQAEVEGAAAASRLLQVLLVLPCVLQPEEMALTWGPCSWDKILHILLLRPSNSHCVPPSLRHGLPWVFCKGICLRPPFLPTWFFPLALQLENHVARLREELDREREERNYFQLERDKIHTFWEITRRQLEEKRAELRNKDREMEEAEERHQVEIKVGGEKAKGVLSASSSM